MAGEYRPGRSAIGGLVEPAPRSFVRLVLLPRRAPRLPQRRVDDLRVSGVGGEVDRAGVGVLVEHLGPRAAAVAGAKHAAIGVRPVGMTQRRHQDDVGVARIDHDLPDVARALESHELPVVAPVRGLVDAGAVGDVGADGGFARADVDDLGIRRRDGERTDRRDLLAIEQRLPGHAGVGGAPHAAVHRAEIKRRGVTGQAGDGQHAAAAVWPDEPPAQRLVGARRDGLRVRGGRRDERRDECESKDGEAGGSQGVHEAGR